MMKRIGLVCVIVMLAVNAFAAESITCSMAGGSQNFNLIKCVCVSDANGAYTASTLVTVGTIEYWKQDMALAHAYAANRSSGQPDTAGTVTITDASGQQIVGSTVGDTLTLSTSASGVGYLSVDRASSQRAVNFPLYLTIGDTQSGSATTTFDLYLLLRK